MDGETYFQANGYSQPRNIMFFVEECLGPEIASGVCHTTLDEIMPKVIIGIRLFLYTGGVMLSTWKTVQLTHLTHPDTTKLCPRSP